MSLEMLAALLIFLFPLAYSPGPGNTFFAAIGASKGLRAAIPSLAGYHVATFVVTAAIGLGMGVTVLRLPIFANTLAAVGCLYVFWLAYKFIKSARSHGSPKGDGVQSAPVNIGFMSGAIIMVVNPKAYYIIAVMFTQFLNPSDSSSVNLVLLITLVFTLNNLVAFVVWTLGGQGLTMLFQSETSKRWIDYFFAATLIAVGIWMALPIFVGH
jgi:threonine/homoserine/homoserine lactone efflux protein